LMTGISLTRLCAVALIALAGCGAPPPPGGASAKSGPPEQLNRIVERYWDERLPQDAISPQELADSLSVERRYLAEVLKISREGLNGDAQLTYDVFRRQREQAIEGFTFPSELVSLNPFDGMTQRLVESALDLRSRKTAADYEIWLKGIDEYAKWSRQIIANMREGVRRGYTVPRSLVERILPILDALGADGPANLLYAPLHSLPATISERERSLAQQLLPAIRALHDYLKQEYLARARTGLALSELPLGPRWYAYRVNRATGSKLAPEEIHRIGLERVEHMGAEAEAAPIAAPDGAPLDAAELVNAYRDLAEKVRAALPDLFSEVPKEQVDIQEAEWLGRPLAPLSYRPGGPAGIPPAVLYVHGARGGARVVVPSFLQQALPGFHFQIALQQERLDLPRFRRFGTEPAFTEGWGMYAASLGEALGMYPDDAAKSDAAREERRCAVGAVVDTGIHAKGWTRAQATDYLRAHLTIEELDAQSLIDWYAANPADALACMMGEREFLALRARSQQLLGGRFDVRQFHSEMLKNGAMPLDILDARMRIWMDASK
jgi:uncharacterized protein (DUF885 family)